MIGKTLFRTAVGLLVAAVVIAVVLFLYVWFTGGSGEPSREATAETVEPVEPESITYRVDRDRSEARFLIEEVLRGEPNTVVGRTSGIDGSIAVQLEPAAVEIGEFEINVRSIRTDDEVRDRSIRTLILESNRDEYEFSSFRPRRVEGVPEVITVGDTLDLDVTGDLTVRDVTTEVTFAMEVSVDSREEISGLATTTLRWDQLEISIPYVGGNSIVSAVEDELELQLEFLAVAEE